MKNNKISRVCVWKALTNNNFSSISSNYKNNNSLSLSYISKNIKTLNFFAFSLIELSIVLIIIGLLVAGITGGKSLIESARIRAFINELNGWKQAVYTFRTAKDRFPGDKDNLGKFGYQSGYSYSKSDFAEPFASGSFVPDTISAPYAELYTEGISDFKPTGNEGINGILGKAFPTSNTFKNLHCSYYFKLSSSSTVNYYFSGFNGNEMLIRCAFSNFSSTNGMEPKVAENIDSKFDDGIFSSGIIRGYCGGTSSEGYNSYENSESNKKKCGIIYYDMKLN